VTVVCTRWPARSEKKPTKIREDMIKEIAKEGNEKESATGRGKKSSL
jgi:hypothetical protein